MLLRSMARAPEKHSSFASVVDAEDFVAQTEVGATDGDEAAVRARGYWEGIWLRLRRDKLALAGAAFIVFLVFAAFAGAPIAAHFLGHGPNDQFLCCGGVDENLLPALPMTHIHVFSPSGKPETSLLVLGGDSTLGRDEFLRVLYGAQVSLEVGLGATFISITLGLLLGAMAGFFRGWVDTGISRLTEITMAFPYLLFVIALASTVGTRLNNVTFGFLGQGVVTLIVVFGLFSWFYAARVFRGITFSLREKEFIEAARTVGTPVLQIALRHLLPTALTRLIVAVTLGISLAIFTEAGLSFLGMGVNVPMQ